MRILIRLVLSILLTSLSWAQEPTKKPTVDISKPRFWTSSSGSRIFALYQGAEDGIVSLKGDDGKMMKIPVVSFSAQDQDYLKKNMPEGLANMATVAGDVPVFAQGPDDPITWLSKQKGKGLTNQDVVMILKSIREFYKTRVPEITLPVDFKEKNPDFFKQGKNIRECYERSSAKVVPFAERKSMITGGSIPVNKCAYEPKWDRLTQQLKADLEGSARANLCQKEIFSFRDKNKICVTWTGCSLTGNKSGDNLTVCYEELLNNKTWIHFEMNSDDYKLGSPLNIEKALVRFTMGIIENEYLYFVQCNFAEVWNFGRTKFALKEQRWKVTKYEDYYSFEGGSRGKGDPYSNISLSLRVAIQTHYLLDGYNKNGKCLSLEKIWKASEARSEWMGGSTNPEDNVKEEHPLNLFSERSKDVE